MSLSWFFFASLTVIGGVVYNIAVKFGGDKINPFVFTTILTLVAMSGHLLCLALYKYFVQPNTSLQYSNEGMLYAVMAGIGVVVIDLAYFYAVKAGGAVSSQAFWTVGSMVALTIVATFFFKEVMTVQKAIGIVMGVTGLYLIIKS